MIKEMILNILAAFLVLQGQQLALAKSPNKIEISIDKMMYSPASQEIAEGQIVVWTNKDLFPHTVTSNGNFDSGVIAPGKTWSYTFKKTGTFEYICKLHPTMKASLKVK